MRNSDRDNSIVYGLYYGRAVGLENIKKGKSKEND